VAVGRIHHADIAPRRGTTSTRRGAAAATSRVTADGSRNGLLGLQREAGNRAVASLIEPIQRAGGWADADSKPGQGVTKDDRKTGWNKEEHPVGAIRRIPLDGLTGGLQSNPEESEGARTLTDEKVAGPVKGAARPDTATQTGRGRAIALVPTGIDTSAPVDVLFHLHGNTENEGRDFAGWRQHERSGEVRDVARDRIAQQIE